MPSLGFRELNGNEFNEILSVTLESNKLRENYRPLEHRMNKTRERLRRSVAQISDWPCGDGLKKYKPEKLKDLK